MRGRPPDRIAARPGPVARGRTAPPPRGAAPSRSYARIYEAVRRVPRGRVASYGQIAAVAGMPRNARLVGYALRALPEGSPVPWHRIVNASGSISRRGNRFWEEFQRELLEREGVRFGRGGRIALDHFGWRPRG
jgi:methylated-DNA-protein-cysteine methyltransferase-like protein